MLPDNVYQYYMYVHYIARNKMSISIRSLYNKMINIILCALYGIIYIYSHYNNKGILTRGINVPVCARVCNYINQLHTCNRIAVCNRLLSARKSLKIWSKILK